VSDGFFFVSGGEFAEVGDGGGDDFEGGGDFGFGGVAAEAETNAGAGFGGGEADGGENVRGLDGPGGAGGSGGAGETLEVECDDEGFALEAGEKEVAGVGRAWGVGGVDAGIGDAGQDSLFESVAQAGDARGVIFERQAGDFGGFAEADDAGDIFGARAEAALVMAAVEKLAEARAALDEKSADALGRVELVAGDGKEIELKRFDVDGDFPGGLYGIGVEVDVGFGGDTADFGERLNGAEFVVGVHHGDENGFGAKGAAEIVEVDETFAIDGKIGDGDALFFESLTGVENGFVFNGSGDDMRGG